MKQIILLILISFIHTLTFANKKINLPQDPLFQYEWHIKNVGQIGDPNLPNLHGLYGFDLNILPVWMNGITGKGINISVLDQGADIHHENLAPNVIPHLSYNYGNGSEDPTQDPEYYFFSHGTSVAGVIASPINGLGNVGVAPGAHFISLGIMGAFEFTVANRMDALVRSADLIDISSNSWGTVWGMPKAIGIEEMRKATQYGVDYGREGKGIIYVFAGRNERYYHPQDEPIGKAGFGWSNYGETSIPYVLPICAANSSGTSSWYSDFGSNLIVCAPSSGTQNELGITTTKNFKNAYKHHFGGTSSATPEVAGVIALLLQSNPKLTWRDVRLILIRTAHIFPSMENDQDAHWISTGAINPYTHNPYRYSLLYGFGIADAAAAVEYAKTFKSLGSSKTLWKNVCQATITPHLTMDKHQPITVDLPLNCGAKKVEFLDIAIELQHPRFRNLDIILTSAMGTKIPLTRYHEYCTDYISQQSNCPTTDFGDLYRTDATIPIDEIANGKWQLQITDKGKELHKGFINSITLSIY